jgi:uncharacterized protein YceK
MKKIFVILLVVSVLGGCASVPMGNVKQDIALKEFNVPNDKNKAGIYVYRNETFGAAIKMYVRLDGEVLGATAANTYLYKEVEPGKHTVSSEAENTSTITVDAKQGMLSYIWQEVKMGMWSARSKLHLVSKEEGRKGVLESNLAETR